MKNKEEERSRKKEKKKKEGKEEEGEEEETHPMKSLAKPNPPTAKPNPPLYCHLYQENQTHLQKNLSFFFSVFSKSKA